MTALSQHSPADATATPGTPRVVIIGAGMSGLCLAIRLRQAGLGAVTLLEKSADVGGTWLENSYPNSGCDIPSFLYSYSFAPRPNWSMKYARQPEILQYFQDCVDRFGLRESIRFNTKVRRAVYDEAGRTWSIETDRGETLTAEFLVSAVGQLNRPRIPELPGLEKFAGPWWHSARWKHDFDLAGKRVAVVGSGASAIQIIPEIAPRVERLFVFQRTPSWIHPRNNKRYSRFAHWLYRHVPLAARLHRLKLFLKAEWRWIGLHKDSLSSRIYEFYLRRRMRKLIPPGLEQALMPDYSPGCKRVLQSNDYLETFHRGNVELVCDPIARCTPAGLQTDAGEIPLDAVIFATGFDTRFLQPLDIRGRGGRSLHESWGDAPRAYLGMLTPGFPNLFFLYGPSTNLGHNSIIFMVECQANYIVKCLKRMQRTGGRQIEVRPEPAAEYDEAVQTGLQSSVWSGDCSSWYKSAEGRISTNWWGPAASYWWHTRRPDFKQLEIT